MRTNTNKREKNFTKSPLRIANNSLIKPSISLRKEPKIINLAVHLEKLTAQLNDGREVSIPIDWFAKWGVENVNAEKLRKYEIWEGDEIYFPDIDEVLGIEVFTKGFDAECE